MKKTKNPVVFLDVSIDGDAAERIMIEVIILSETPSSPLDVLNFGESCICNLWLPVLTFFFFE